MTDTATTAAPVIHGPVPIGSTGALRAAVLAMLKIEQGAGTIPADRNEPGEADLVLYIGEEREPEAVATFYFIGNKRMWFDLLMVHADHRGKGLGTALLAAFVAAAKERGCTGAELGTLADNEAMRGLAEYNGWLEKALVLELDFAGE